MNEITKSRDAAGTEDLMFLAGTGFLAGSILGYGEETDEPSLSTLQVVRGCTCVLIIQRVSSCRRITIEILVRHTR